MKATTSRPSASVTYRKTTELGDLVTTTLSFSEGTMRQDIVIEGPGELQDSPRRTSAGKVWPGGGHA